MHVENYPSPPLCEKNAEVPKFDGNNTYSCSDKGVVCMRSENRQAVRATQSIIEVLTTMSAEAHQDQLLGQAYMVHIRVTGAHKKGREVLKIC